MLQRMVANLIDNAIKYTPEGGRVHVGIRADGGSCEMTVENTGPGIPREDQAKVFQRFFRGDQSRSQGGAGLGLSLVYAIVTAHGGSINLESLPARYTRFRIRLPLVAQR